MDLFDFLNNNPIYLLAIFSLVAFPMGLLLLAFAARKLGLGGLVKVMSDHVAAEVKIETRLQEIVSELKNLLTANWDNRRYLDDKLDHFDARLNHVDASLTTIISLIPKRKGET